MAGMARHGSAAFSGFSVCQPALGAALQWLPAIGTPELDDMINAFLPGPASIQDKRAHISMDFFEYSRQTGETFKFYPVASESFTPVTASPANSAFCDSGYASSFNHSPVLSEQGSWTQSPAPFAASASASDARTKSRSSTKKCSSSSSRSQLDFANHPGMRILTKDGQDVTNSASRGCKTKEQRDHAHLMRIIKACDACRRKKIRCDPSHRKRNASQASVAQAEQKPAKKPKKAEAPPPVAVAAVTPEFLVGDAFDAPETTLSLPTFETGQPQDFEEFWNDFITFDQEPLAVAAQFNNDFLFDSFTDSQHFFSPSTESSSASPSQVFTPSTPAVSRTSPSLSDVGVDATGEVSLHDPTVPYLNPGVAHGINYVDFNLFSPGPDVFDEDPVLQMVDLGSQRSPQERGIATPNYWWSQEGADGVNRLASTTTVSGRYTTASSVGGPGTSTSIARFLDDPGSTDHGQAQSGGRRSPSDRRAVNHTTLVEAARSQTADDSSVQAPVSEIHAPSLNRATASIVSAGVLECLVQPGSSPRPRRLPSTGHTPGSSPVLSTASSGTTQSGGLESSVTTAPLTATSCYKSPEGANHTASRAALEVVRDDGQGVTRSASSQILAGVSAARKIVHDDGVGTVALNAVLATISTTLPTRRFTAGEDAKKAVARSSLLSSTLLFQLAVFGLVSLLCASSLQSHLGLQVNLVNMLLITSVSLARLASSKCAGPSSVTWVTSRTLPSQAPSGLASQARLKVQAVGRSLRDLQSAVVQRAGNSVPCLASARSVRF